MKQAHQAVVSAGLGFFQGTRTGVPLTMYPWYLLDSLGSLGDDLPINTHVL